MIAQRSALLIATIAMYFAAIGIIVVLFIFYASVSRRFQFISNIACSDHPYRS